MDILFLQTFILKLILKIAICKKPYPYLIHKKFIRGHYAQQKFYVYTTSHSCRFGSFVLRQKCILTAKNVIIDAAEKVVVKILIK